ncbi:MAG: glycosyltransferase family 9 protein [Methylococcaceae bacterium]|nr:glycosyltransferase family 9 protein [Methylococcaceae bacterium]MCI0667528.1 glycosyltransferase family 9 protein [Methylococcaceae bacterium]MCI0732615.1 glycosyltransferase family 9 protein [Methylococcaceae bacterium]
MNLTFLRSIDRLVGIWICKGLSFYSRIFPGKESSNPPEKILVILLSEMGSLVLAYPMFQRLKEKYPEASISVLLFEKNREMLEILGVVREENILTIRDQSLRSFLFDSLRVLLKMRRFAADVAVDCELFARISSILSFLSGAGIRAGFSPYSQEGLYRGSFINRPVLYNPYQHISRQYLTLVEALESGTVPTGKRVTRDDRLETPNFDPHPSDVEKMVKRLCRDFPVCHERKLVLIYPSGGILPIRAWPMDYYRILAAALLDKGFAVGVIGLGSDKPLARKIIDHCGSSNIIDLTGYTRSIRELMLLFHHAVLLITNDGGPGQFAAMTPIQTIIFFGPESPELYGSHSRNAHFFYTGLSCSPCLTAYNHRNSPCDGDNQCLKRIAPEQVFTKALEMIQKSSAPPARITAYGQL